MDIRRVNDKLSVSPQVLPEDVPAIKAAGFVAIVNNRPDGEAPGQPTSDALKQAADAHGLSYHAIPVGRAGISGQMIADMKAALDGADGPVIGFCRSGTRSVTLWALSQAGVIAAEEILSSAAGAGYDMSHLLPHLRG